MKRVIFVICLLSPIFIAAVNPILEDAKTMAKRIYSKIDIVVDEKVEKLTKNDYATMYGRDKNGSPIYTAKKYANDLFLLKGMMGDKSVCPETYFGEIEEFVNSNNVDFKYEITGAKFCVKPELKEEDPMFANVFVKKEWMVDGKTYRINDIVQIDLVQKCVVNIYNEFMSLQDCPEETVDDMLAKAAGLYNNRDYVAAAALYNKILKDYPNNDEAWYDLGVMYFKNQGVGSLSRQQRLQKAYDCWKNSNLKKACRAISYITDGREGC